MSHATSSAGFTLIETFVAVLVLVFAVVGPLTLTSRSLNATLSARDELVGTYLAQEAIEHVRYLRDSSMLRGEDWMTNLGNCINQDCMVDVWDLGAVPEACSNDGCAQLEYNEATHKYGYGNGGELTQFVRSVHIYDTSQSHEKTVVVVVAWQSGTRSHALEIRENMLNWASGVILPQ